VRALEVGARVTFTSIFKAPAPERTGESAVIEISNWNDNLIRFEDGTTLWAHSKELKVIE
jgi:hypothetical protein